MAEPAGAQPFAEKDFELPLEPLKITLAGATYTILPGEEAELYSRSFHDTEQLLALHRFAWIYDKDVEPDWAVRLWRQWLSVYSNPVPGNWPWHPYTAAERLINLLYFFRNYGVPSPADESHIVLARHGPSIWDQLEFYGDAYTGNHLANNGRGLYLGGLQLNASDWIEAGSRILLHEADRIFDDHGFLNEGSSHYHLLATKWYAECWLAAEEAGRPEAARLGDIACHALSAASMFAMPGGLPLIGDISPDCPPDDLVCLAFGEKTGWLERLSGTAPETILSCRVEARTSLKPSAWRRRQMGSWSAIWHAPPLGWPEQPGHAHQDFGGFELHYGNQRVLIDPGRLSYGPEGEDDISAKSHNTLLIDGQGAYPENKPYYGKEFREKVCGPSPDYQDTSNGFSLTTRAVARLSGVDSWRRSWAFKGEGLRLRDEVAGNGRHRMYRVFHTPFPVTASGGEIQIGPVVLRTKGEVSVLPARRSLAYGQSEPSFRIIVSNYTNLPWTGDVEICPAS